MGIKSLDTHSAVGKTRLMVVFIIMAVMNQVTAERTVLTRTSRVICSEFVLLLTTASNNKISPWDVINFISQSWRAVNTKAKVCTGKEGGSPKPSIIYVVIFLLHTGHTRWAHVCIIEELEMKILIEGRVWVKQRVLYLFVGQPDVLQDATEVEFLYRKFPGTDGKNEIRFSYMFF